MIDDVKIRLLAFEDRWHFVAILCCKAQGILDKNPEPPEILDRWMGVKLGLASRELDEVRRRLMEVGLIDDQWQPIGWDGRQYVKSDHDGADRARASRDRNVTLPHASVSVSVSASEEEEEPEAPKTGTSSLTLMAPLPLIDIVKKEYPRGIHNAIRPYTLHTIYQLDNIDTRKLVIDGVKRYAASIRAQGNEGTKYVMSINTFFANDSWKAEWPLPEKQKDGPLESDDEKARRARAREMLEKMERGELDKF